MTSPVPSPDIERLAHDIRAGTRTVLSRAITLIESKRADHRRTAAALTQELLKDTGNAVRVGITGAPGVGKSTMIEALGSFLTGQGHKVAVLAVDPSSRRTGGSILADKTRMAKLANDERAFIRPSPSSGTLGGVAARTRETMLLCEAAGYDVVLVETVGVGQSEVAVADMTDFFLVLALPGAGDELQALKKGVVELADMIAVNKADGDNIPRAKLAAAEYGAALHILAPRSPNWSPPVITCSALKGDGIEAVWAHILDHRKRLTASGELQARRGEQQVKWMWTMLEERLFEPLHTDRALKAAMPRIETEVAAGRLVAGERRRTDRRDARAVTMRVLLTGFGPFPGAPFNPSALLVKALSRRRRPALADVEIITHVFPTSYAAVDRDLPKLLAREPDVVLLFGLAGRRRHLCIETRAQNAMTLVYPDADRRKPRQCVITPGAPPSLRGNAPFMRLLNAARGRFPSRLSRDAGRYLCNYIFWQALQRARRRPPAGTVRSHSTGRDRAAARQIPAPIACRTGSRCRSGFDRVDGRGAFALDQRLRQRAPRRPRIHSSCARSDAGTVRALCARPPPSAESARSPRP